jgi:hypothetical protein
LSHQLKYLKSGRAFVLAVAVAGALLGFLFASQHASAYGVNYCAGWLTTGTQCTGPQHTLVANIVYDDTGSGSWVCEIAVDGGGNYYGGWGCGYGQAETCYAGNRLLRGAIYNGSGYYLYMNGTEFYSQGCP